MTVKTFIDRPILAGVISVLIVILGVLGLVQLPIEQFPNIAPPTVRVQASYTGANAETVMKSVIVPLEESLNGQGGECPVGVLLHYLRYGIVDFRGIMTFYSPGIVFQKLGEALGVGVSVCSHFGRV